MGSLKRPLSHLYPALLLLLQLILIPAIDTKFLFRTNRALFITNRSKNKLNTVEIRNWSCWILYLRLFAHFMKHTHLYLPMCIYTKYPRSSKKYFRANSDKCRVGFLFKFLSADWNQVFSNRMFVTSLLILITLFSTVHSPWSFFSLTKWKILVFLYIITHATLYLR